MDFKRSLIVELLSLSLSLYNLSNPNLIPRRCLDRPDVYTVSTSFSQVYHVRTEGGVTAGAGGNETKKKELGGRVFCMTTHLVRSTRKLLL